MSDLGGRPSKWQDRFVDDAKRLVDLGATDEEVARFLRVQVRTLQRWKHQYPEFCRAFGAGGDAADDRVERSLYQRAIGYKQKTVKIFQHEGEPVIVPYVEIVPADVGAAKYWLASRRRKQWGEQVKHEHSGTVTLESLVATANGSASE
jgi:hypothetical protein